MFSVIVADFDWCVFVLAKAAVLPQALAGKNVVVAAETGSGKTLSYLVPIAHNIISRRKAEADSDTGDVNAKQRLPSYPHPSSRIANRTRNKPMPQASCTSCTPESLHVQDYASLSPSLAHQRVYTDAPRTEAMDADWVWVQLADSRGASAVPECDPLHPGGADG